MEVAVLMAWFLKSFWIWRAPLFTRNNSFFRFVFRCLLEPRYRISMFLCHPCHFLRMTHYKVRVFLFEARVLREELDIAFSRIKMRRLHRKNERLYFAKFGSDLPVFNSSDQSAEKIVNVFEGNHEN